MSTKDEPRAIDRLFKDRAELYAALRAAEDHAAMWVYDLTVARKQDGLGAATQALERIGKRVDAVEERMHMYSSSGANDSNTVYIGFLPAEESESDSEDE